MATALEDRAARIAMIRNSALARAALGLTSGYIVDADGKHVITVLDRATRTVNTYAGVTLAEAVDAARRGEGYC